MHAFFEHPVFQDELITRAVSIDFYNIIEPNHCDDLVIENSFEDYVENKVLVEQALDFLKENVRKSWYFDVLLYRYGFKTGEEITLEEIGKLSGVSRERIRQVEADCLEILRKYKVLRWANL